MDRPAEEYPLFRRFLPGRKARRFFTLYDSLFTRLPPGGSCRRSRLRGRPPQSRLLVGGCAAGCQPSANLQPPGSPRPRRKCAVTSIFAQQKSRRRANSLRSELILIRAPAKAQLLWDRWILRYPKRRKIQKIPIGVYPVYLMSTKNNLGTCCSAIAVKRFPLHVERVNVYPDEKFCILQTPESRSWSGFRAFLADFVRGAMRL